MRRWILALAITLCYASAIDAAPYLNLWLEARKQSGNADFASSLNVALGDTIEYRLRVDVAPIGTTNTVDFLTGDFYRTIRELVPGRDGVTSLPAMRLFQSSSDAIQTHFESPAVLTGESTFGANDGWNSGTGARGGVPTLRPGSNWNDLADLRGVPRAGVRKAIDAETVLTGIASVTEILGPFSQLNIELISSYGIRINGGSLLSTPQIESKTDPISCSAPSLLPRTTTSATIR
jgi:hypothetical protein